MLANHVIKPPPLPALSNGGGCNTIISELYAGYATFNDIDYASRKKHLLY